MAFVFALFCLTATAQDPASQAGQTANQAGQAAGQAGQQAEDAAPAEASSAQVDEALEKMGTSLNLTDAQKDKIKPILQDEVTKLHALRSDNSMSDEQKHAQAQQIHESANSEIQSVLTPEQQQKLQEMQEQK